MSNVKLSDLDFVNLYIRLDAAAPSRYAPVQRPDARPMPGVIDVPEQYEESIGYLCQQIQKISTKDFSLDLTDMRLRGAQRKMVGDEIWCCLRKIPPTAPDLDTLGFAPGIVEQFRTWGGRRGGLILVGGATSAGKTTTAVSILMDYLKRRGRVAYTIEDPVEFNLHGPVGQGGHCFQIEVREDKEWAEAMMTAMRFAPRYIFLGEVRTPAAARHLLRASVSGHLAMCTIHGGSIEETLASLLQTAEIELGETAKSLLADGLCAVVHQQLIKGAPQVQLLQVEGAGGSAEGIRSAIRTGKLQTLGTYIYQQEAVRNGPGSGGGAGAQPAKPTFGAQPTRPAGAGSAAPTEKKKSWF